MNKLTEYFFRLHSHHALRFMPRVVYGFLIIVWITTWPYRHLAWGSYSVLMRTAMHNSLLDNIIFQLYYRPPLFVWIYCAHLAAAVLSLWNHRVVFAARFVAWITGIMLYQTAPGLVGAGIFVLLNFAFILIPVHYQNEHRVRRWFNSISIFALRLQTLIVLITVALYMWGSMQWKEGSALYYLLHQPSLAREFVTDFAREKTDALRILSCGLLWLASAIPLLVFFRPTRYYAALTMITSGIIAMFIFQPIMVGVALIVLGLPWIDARTNYNTTPTPQ